jgi:uncharacterized protein DUF4440
MKRCPTCKREYEESLTYCLDDGSPLVSDSRPDSDPTLVSPSPAQQELPPTQFGQAPPQFNAPAIPSYGPTPQKARVWPWMLAGGVVLFLFVLIVAAVIVIPKLATKSKNSNGPVAMDSPSPEKTESPSWTASPGNASAPTDEDVVLAQLTALEKQWTLANIQGDKDTLDQVLAEDYRGGNPSHNKQQYIDEIQPDPTVKSWELQDLSVDLDGDRATMTGYLRQETAEGTQVYSFTDEFVWRDGRWQATGSRTTRVK